MSERETLECTHPHPDSELTGSRVLLVDDDPQSVGILQPILISKGYSVEVAGNGQDALDAVERELPDAIILDIDMPGRNGLEVCSTLKNDERTRFIPVVMLTGLTEFENKLKSIDAGADDFVNKPFNSIELLTRIRSLLRVRRLYRELDSAESILFTMARAIEAKDNYTQGHVERVASLAGRFGEWLGMPREDLEGLKKGGLLHDIGKIGVPDHILNKPGALDANERAVIQKHPGEGAAMCGRLNSIRTALPAIRHHHERLDGTGYPDHLQGTEIPDIAQIMTIVDIYDALTSTRSYRTASSPQAALQVLWDEVQRGWRDRDLVTSFQRMIEKECATIRST